MKYNHKLKDVNKWPNNFINEIQEINYVITYSKWTIIISKIKLLNSPKPLWKKVQKQIYPMYAGILLTKLLAPFIRIISLEFKEHEDEYRICSVYRRIHIL